MRTVLLALVACFSLAAPLAALAQSGAIPGPCNCPNCVAARQAAAVQQAAAQQAVVQQAGHGAAANCPPGGYPAGPHSMGTGTFPYGSQYDRGHPGKLADGGHYGYFGGAHRTPGYPHHHHMHREYVGPQGPPTAQVAYPYYTTRGPRDFLIDNPPTIGR